MKATKRIFLFFLILIPLHQLFEKLIESYIIIPILQHIERSLINDIVSLTLVTYLFYEFCSSKKKNVYISNEYICNVLVCSIIYIYYRFNSNWIFTEFYIIKKIYYSDIFLIFSILEIVKKCIYTSKIKTDNEGFLYDNSLGKRGEDKLNRENYAKTIAEKINVTESDSSAFSIGINGDWGTGKTSFIELIQRNLDKEKNIIISFNPWLHNGVNSIVKEFFKNLSLEINIYNSSLSNNIDNYSNLLLKQEESGLNKFLRPLIKLNNSNKIAQDEYTEISTSISNLNKKLIVFIDDLDRLDCNEIKEVLRIIRNTANFANTIFVVAYDRNYLANALKKINSHKHEYYLEKIFQLEILLPDYSIETINNKTFELIKDKLNKKDKTLLETHLFDKNRFDGYPNSINSTDRISINTIREATRFSNSFLLSYEQLKGEVNPLDLYDLELLKLKKPEIYSLIFKEKDTYLTLFDIEKENRYVEKQKKYYSLKKTNDNKDGNPIYEIEKYLKETNHESNNSNKSIEKTIDLLKQLFPDKEFRIGSSNKELPDLSIAYPNCFYRYTHFRLFDSNMSQVHFDEYLNGGKDGFSKKIIEWDSRGLRNELAEKFRLKKNFESKEEFEKTIIGIFNFARLHSENDNYLIGYDHNDLINKIDNSNNRLSDKLYESNTRDYEDFIENIFIEAPAPFTFDIDFLATMENKISHRKIIDSKFIENQKIKYLEKYLTSIKEFNYTIFRLYYKCNLKNNNTTEETKTNPRANELLKEFILEKDIDGFLNKMVEFDRMNEIGYCVSSFAKKLFGSFVKFKEFLDSIETNKSKLIKEFLEFFHEFEKVNYEKYIRFDFKKIIPPK